MKLRCHRPSVERLEDRCVPAGFIAVGTDVGPIATVRLFADNDLNGAYETLTAAFQPFAGSTFGVRVALGDFDGDGNDELVGAQGTGGISRVIVWDLNSDGTPGTVQDDFLAFGSFKGGVFVAAGDLNGDGRDELVVSRGKGVGVVSVYSDTNRNGRLSDNLTDQFLPFGAFPGGVRIALGNTNNIGGDELIVAKGPGGNPLVSVFTDGNANLRVSDELLLESFLAYENKFKGGVFVAAGAFQSAGGNGAEIMVGPGDGRPPLVKIFTDTNNNGLVSDNALFDSYSAYQNTFKGGVRVAAADTDLSSFFVEAITVPGPGLAGRLVIRDDSVDAGSLISDNPVTQDSIVGGNKGAFVAFGKVNSGIAAFTGFPQTIPDSSTLNTVITVAPGEGIIRDLDINLSIFHSFDGDLDVTLTHVPSGVSVILFQDVGGSNEGFFIRLNDEAGTDINGATNPKIDGAINGTFNPGGTALLSAFDGLDASGEWRLTIVDDSSSDTGTLFGWSLNFTF